ncbi:MAG: hypothetical protein M1549_01215 [Candidatus Dependentiae bacterium]|nr:hypothetical protein [Candidatus Dependentiae bacterium]
MKYTRLLLTLVCACLFTTMPPAKAMQDPSIQRFEDQISSVLCFLSPFFILLKDIFWEEPDNTEHED